MIGQNTSHYRTVEKPGGGCTGVVHKAKAEDMQLRRVVELKFPPRRVSKELPARERFQHRPTGGPGMETSEHQSR